MTAANSSHDRLRDAPEITMLSTKNHIRLSQEFALRAMKSADFISPAQSDSSNVDLVSDIVEDVLLSLARSSQSGELIDESGNISDLARSLLSQRFGWHDDSECVRLLVRDFRQVLKSQKALFFSWATFELAASGCVTWSAHQQSHDSGMEPPSKSVRVELPAHRKVEPTCMAEAELAGNDAALVSADAEPYTLPTETVQGLISAHRKLSELIYGAPSNPELDVATSEAANWIHHQVDKLAQSSPEDYQGLFARLSSMFSENSEFAASELLSLIWDGWLMEEQLMESPYDSLDGKRLESLFEAMRNTPSLGVSFALSLVADALYRHALENDDFATLELMLETAEESDAFGKFLDM